MYGMTEREVKGDGNCMFRALSDQLYRTPRLHAQVGVLVHLPTRHHAALMSCKLTRSHISMVSTSLCV